MATIQVPDMHCDKCVERITKLLAEDGLDFSVSLAQKTVTVNGCEHCVQTAVEDLQDLGFNPEVK